MSIVFDMSSYQVVSHVDSSVITTDNCEQHLLDTQLQIMEEDSHPTSATEHAIYAEGIELFLNRM